MVGKTGFEPATAWSQTKCSTKLNYFPKYGALEGIRTPDLLVRSQTLYPTELRAHLALKLILYYHCFFASSSRIYKYSFLKYYMYDIINV